MKYLLDDFEKQRMLGTGAHGLVMLWRSRKDPHRKFAAKMFSPTREASFRRETEIYQHNRGHPHLLALEASIEQDGKCVHLFPFYDGGDLFGALKWMEKKRSSPATWTRDERLSWLIDRWLEVADALRHMHERCNWVHMDVKPENIFLSKDGTKAVLGDLGGSVKIGHRFDERGCQTGTISYWPPELLDRGRHTIALPSMDAFGMGKILVLILNVLWDDMALVPEPLAAVAIGLIESDPVQRLSLAIASEMLVEHMRGQIKHDPLKNPPFLFGNWTVTV